MFKVDRYGYSIYIIAYVSTSVYPYVRDVHYVVLTALLVSSIFCL